MKSPNSRFRIGCGELLEGRYLLNAAPVAVADTYEIEKDTVLVADRPPGVESFTTDFSDGLLGPHLEGDGFVVRNGAAYRQGATHVNDRAYVRTVDMNLLDADLRFEVSVRMSDAPEPAIYFVGLGSGEGDQNNGGGEPLDSLYLRIHGVSTAGGYVSIANSPANDLEVIGTLPATGTHRVRIEKLGNTATFSIDQNYDGTFVPDISHEVSDIPAIAPFLTEENSHLFFGTAVQQDFFDDVSLDVLSVPGVLANDADPDGDALLAALTSDPTSGTVDFLANGTFTYQPDPGFVGTDTFTYVARDAELSSEPTQVSILVTSTNVPPVAVADHYEIPQDTVLSATRPQGSGNIHVDFEGDTLFPHLEGAGFVVEDGVVRRHGASDHNDRQYVRTREAGFLDVDFRYEITLNTSIVEDTAIYFVGIGSGRGEAAYNEPSDSIHLAILGPNTVDSRVDVHSHPLGPPVTTIGYLPEPGAHRIRLEKIGNTLTFAIDALFDGQFEADILYRIDDLEAAAPLLTSESTRLFFGTAIEEDYFDDFSIEFLSPAGVLANDIDADTDELKAELLTEPEHGSVTLESDGTFTYTPQAGFVGTDTFTYRATDDDSASEPTQVSITVTSTNVAPVAVADSYQMLRGESLQVPAEAVTQQVSEQVFYTDFEQGVPSQFTGTTTMANVQNYAGLGTGENVFSGRMLRNQTGVHESFPQAPFQPVIPTRLVLNNLPEHESVDINFLLAAIDSWDGNSPVPDILAVTVDGVLVFVETLDGTSLADQSYAPPQGVLLAHNDNLGFNQEFGDAAYDMGLEPRFRRIPHTSENITIEWFTYGSGWTAGFSENESWGIDNVEVIANARLRPPLGVLANDADEDDQALSAVLESPPAHGTLSLAEDGSFTYTPDEGFAGLDAFAYRASDGSASSDPAWVTIDVRPNSDPVTAIDDRYDIPAGQQFVAGQQRVIGDIATGFAEQSSEKLRDLGSDTDYRVVASPDSRYTGMTATTMPGEQPIGGYLPDSGSAESRWVGILRELPLGFDIEPGEYVFETTIEVPPDVAAATAWIQGLQIAADNSLVAMSINGVPVLNSTVVGFDRLIALGDVGLGAFQPGINVLQFKVVNDNGGRNPLGLRVEGRVVAQGAPDVDPSTGVLANDFVSSFASVGGQIVSVGGPSDPYLAGMPAGTLASAGDVAPAQSPVLVPNLSIRPGDVLRFEARGQVGTTHNLQLFTIDNPDGGLFYEHHFGAQNGLSNVIAPLNAVVGVFLSEMQPNFFAAPPTLDFRVGGSVPGGLNYARLEPRVQQVFFIGDGVTSTGQRQEVVVPQGATRLFLGIMDGFRWADNIGRFDVKVHTTSDVQAGAVLRDAPAHGQVQLAADGSFTYTPNPGFTGVDEFTYEVANGLGDTDTASVVLRVGETVLPGDYNGNGLVEQEDLDLVLLHWGQEAAQPPPGWIGNLPSGRIDQNELDAVLSNWGATIQAVASAAPAIMPLEEANDAGGTHRSTSEEPNHSSESLSSPPKKQRTAPGEAVLDQLFTRLGAASSKLR